MSDKLAANLYFIFICPIRAFKQIEQGAIGYWLPLLLVVGSSVVMFSWYFLSVDLRSFLDSLVPLSGQVLSNAELDLVLRAELPIRLLSVLITSMALFIAYIFIGVYFWCATRLAGPNTVTFNQCLSLVFWSNIPTLLSILSIAISYMFAEPSFVLLHSLDITSLSSVLGLNSESRYFHILSTVNLGTLWAYGLYCLGFKALTSCKLITAIAVGVLLAVVHIGLVLFL